VGILRGHTHSLKNPDTKIEQCPCANRASSFWHFYIPPLCDDLRTQGTDRLRQTQAVDAAWFRA
jgi:hypothetical protein